MKETVHHPCFKDWETEAKRGSETCLRILSESVVEMQTDCGSIDSLSGHPWTIPKNSEGFKDSHGVAWGNKEKG